MTEVISGGYIVKTSGPAQRAGLQAGDRLLKAARVPLRDIIDFWFYADGPQVEIEIGRQGRRMTLWLERDAGESWGLDFDQPLFDGLRRCSNHCLFCFLDQLPPGWRRSLYLRDDDYRLSFLYGNFVTLTNLRPADWDRLDEQHLSPLYVSVHATDPVLRRILLGRSDLPDIRAQLLRLEQLAIEVHAQIVLCPGINDGEYLQQTLSDLEERSRSVVSVALVPVGLTRFRNERSVVLPGETAHLRSYTPTEAREMLSWAGPLQRSFRQRWGRNLLYLSDEFYLLAGRSVPAARFYDDFPQLENGVGLVRLLREDWFRARRRLPAKLPRPLRMSLVCGTMIAPMLREFARECQERTELLTIEVLALENQTFGPLVTVSGLLTGECLRAGLRGRTLGDVVVMPRVAFEQSGRCTLDEVSLSDLAAELQCPLLLADQMSEVVEALNQIDRGNPPSPLFTDLRYPTF